MNFAFSVALKEKPPATHHHLTDLKYECVWVSFITEYHLQQ
jgi:hypothetical protein